MVQKWTILIHSFSTSPKQEVYILNSNSSNVLIFFYLHEIKFENVIYQSKLSGTSPPKKKLNLFKNLKYTSIIRIEYSKIYIRMSIKNSGPLLLVTISTYIRFSVNMRYIGPIFKGFEKSRAVHNFCQTSSVICLKVL